MSLGWGGSGFGVGCFRRFGRSGDGLFLARIVGLLLRHGDLRQDAAAEEAVTRKDGVEITVKLDSGRVLAITQAADEEFRVGDRVRVLTGGGVTRVTR